MFAKLTEDEELGQILLTKETVDHPELEDETCPAIKVQLSVEGARVGIELPFPNDEDGFYSRDKVFDDFTDDQARKVARDIMNEIIELADKEQDDEESD
jgi:hypothetical protein